MKPTRGWTDHELAAVGDSDELRIGTIRDNRLVFVPIWVVRAESRLFIRSYRGAGARWYKRAREQGHAVIDAGGITRNVTTPQVGEALADKIDEAYRRKYGRYGDAYLIPMTATAATATTLEILPRQ